jgi:(1->4)-alpha-D-glucan 1-alpha-D-glucosylmutase
VIDEWNDPADGALRRLDELISAQPYRLSSWRVAGEEINYRRFFDVNTLAAIRMELPEVFDETHRLLFELLDAEHLSGVRIDHIDGLAHPREYLMRLRTRGGPDLYLLVEKILGPDEKLRPDWPVQGTTGYDFAIQVAQLLVAGQGMADVAATYDGFLGFRLDYREVVYRSKKLITLSSMAGEVNVLGHLLNRIAESNRWYRDFTVNALTAAVREVIACFLVYRTYLDPTQPVDDMDKRLIERALAVARRRNYAMERSVLTRNVLLAKENAHPVNEELRRAFVLKFQQCTGPITAGVSRTPRFTSSTSLGAERSRWRSGLDKGWVSKRFTARARRVCGLPRSLLATSTHDTKRSEDGAGLASSRSRTIGEWSRVHAGGGR